MTGPTRIAQVITRFIAGAGGITLRGALGLDRDRYSVTVLGADGGPLFAEAERAGFETVRLHHMCPEPNAREDVRGLLELTEHIRAGGFDLVHTHSAKAGALGRMAARRAGVPAIVHSFHGFPFHDFQSPARRAMLITMERRLGRITDQFLTDGGAIAAEAVRLRIAPPERIYAIDSPVDTDIPALSAATRARARRLLGIPSDLRVVGSVGRLDEQKAPEDMVAAMARLDRADVRLVWLGDGRLRTHVERLIASKGLSDRCLLLGDRRDVATLLPAFDVFAMSSLYEGLPCAVIEAMTCGVPVVATAVNSVPEVVVPGRTGLLVPPRDPARLARAITYLLGHPDQAARMAAEARDRLGGRFRAEALGRTLGEVYDLALGQSPSPGATSPSTMMPAGRSRPQQANHPSLRSVRFRLTKVSNCS
jgi:glycosyltransferase involved in cell wall biosynthesis